MRTYKKYLLLIILVFLAVGLRLYRWDEKFSFNAEYNYKLWPMLKIITEKKIPLIGIEAASHMHHLHYPPFFLYIFTPLLWISAYNPAAIELSFIFLSGLTTTVFFLLGRELKNDTTGYLVAFLYAVSFFSQLADKLIWVVGGIYAICGLAFFLFIRLIKQEKPHGLSAFLLGAVISLGLNFHYQVMLMPLGLLGILWMKKFRQRLNRNTCIAFVAGLVFFLVPLLIFDLRHDFYNLKGIILLLQKGEVSFSFSQRIINSLNLIPGIFLALFLPINPLNRIFYPHLFIVLTWCIIILFGLYLLKKSSQHPHEKIFINYLLSMLLCGFLVYVGLKKQFSYYLFIMQPVFITIVALVFRYGLDIRKLKPVVIALTIFLFVYNTYTSLNFTNRPSYKYQIEALDQFFKQQKTKTSIFFPSFASEEYAFLIYYSATKNKFNYSDLNIHEPWQVPNQAEYIFTINSKPTATGGPLIIKR